MDSAKNHIDMQIYHVVMWRLRNRVEYENICRRRCLSGSAYCGKIAEKYEVSVTLLSDTNHVISSDYSEVMIVGAGSDAVDFKLISLCHQGDIVVTQDYGVAAMALGKNAYAIHQSGKKMVYE